MRERAMFLDMIDVRDGYKQPNLSPRRSPEYECPRQEQNSDQLTRDGDLIVEADDDLEIPAITYDDLPLGKRSKAVDDERTFTWLLQWELGSTGAYLDRIESGEIFHARSHNEVRSVVRRFQTLAKEAGDALVIGFDTEGMTRHDDPATLQFSAAAGGSRINAVVQMRSGVAFPNPAHIFQEGHPEALKEIFRIPNAIFVGKSIAADMLRATRILGIPKEEADDYLIIDTDRLFHLADALARGKDEIEAWMKADGEAHFLGEISLKFFAQLIDPDKILDKNPSHCNHHSNFAEAKYPMSSRDLCYAALDARRASEAVERFAEILGVRGEHLATSIGMPVSPNSVIFSSILTHVAQAYGKPLDAVTATIDRMPREFAELFSGIRDAIPFLTRRMAKTQKNILEFRTVKRIISRMFKVRRDNLAAKNVYEIHRKEPDPRRVFPPTQPPLQLCPPRAADGGDDDDDGRRVVRDEIGDDAADDLIEGDVIDEEDVIDEPTATAVEEPTSSSSGDTGDTSDTVQSEIEVGPKPKLMKVTIANNPDDDDEYPEVFSPTLVSYPSLPFRSVALPSTPPPPPSSSLAPIADSSAVPAGHTARYRNRVVPTARDQNIRDYDARMAMDVYTRLRCADESRHLEILREFEAPTERQSINRCISILVHFNEHGGGRWKTIPLARTMMTLFPTQIRAFVAAIFREKVLGSNRLKIAVELDHFLLSPFIILAELFSNPFNLENVKRAALAFPASKVMAVVRFLAKNSDDPRAVVAEMRKTDCFRENYTVNWERLKWTTARVREFVEAVCTTVGAEIPVEARPFLLRFRLDKAYASYRAGETEIEDLYKICLMLCDDDDDEFETIMEYFAARSNPITEFFAMTRGQEFLFNPQASVSVPSCAMPAGEKLHSLACPSHTVIRGDDSAEVFERHVKESRHFAIGLHRSAEFEGRGTLFMFRFRDHVVFYLPGHSRKQQVRMTTILSRHAKDKRVFILQKELVLDFCDEHFSWAPALTVDVAALTEIRSVSPTLGGIRKLIADSVHCGRGKNFAAGAIPSKICLLHRNIDISLLYEFCTEALDLKEQDRADIAESRQARKRERTSSSDGSTSRARSRK